MSAEELIEDFDTFQRERGLKNTYYDWLGAVLMTERIHVETAPDFAAHRANREDQLDQMRRRVYAVKLKGDERIMAKTRKKKTSTEASPTAQSTANSSKGKRTRSAKESSAAGKPQPVVAAAAPPKVGDQYLTTEADFQKPSHPRLSDYKYYAMLDNKNRIVGRGFLARVDKDTRRTWFALRNDEQTELWKTSKWAMKEISLERYEELTLKYIKAEGFPEFKAAKAAAA
jgi:hypothetical protein